MRRNPKLATFFPAVKGRVISYLKNVVLRMAPVASGGADLAVKYDLNAAKVTKLNTLTADIPLHLAKATELRNLAKAERKKAVDKIRQARLLNREFGDSIQRHDNFTHSDLELLGYHVEHAAADDTKAKVKISHITPLPDMIRFDWVKKSWNGISIYGSYDDEHYKFLDKDNRSPWEDTRKNRAANTPENRYYIFRYLDKDGKEIGQDLKVQVVAAVYL
jgi:hypothetical protein